MGQVLGELTRQLDSFIEGVIEDVRKFFGIKTIAGSSVGAAVRPASIGSVEDYGAKARTAAFSLGTAASTPEAKTAEYTGKILAVLEQIYTYIKNPKKLVEDVIDRGTPEVVKDGLDTARSLGLDSVGGYAANVGTFGVYGIGKKAGFW